MNEKLAALELLLATFEKLVAMKSCEQGEKSHALWNMTDFIKREIRELVKDIKRRT